MSFPENIRIETQNPIEELSSTDARFPIILGSLLGDASIVKPTNCKNPTCHYGEGHCGDQFEYLPWKMLALQQLSRGWKINFPSGKFKVNGYCQLSSRSDKIFNYFHTLFYTGPIKGIRIQTLDLLNELGLAIWFCDDGSISPENRYAKGGSLKLATCGFSKEDHSILQHWFYTRLGINALIGYDRKKGGKVYQYLYFTTKQAQLFLSLVAPYIHNCMAYKLDLNLHNSFDQEIDVRYPDYAFRSFATVLAGNIQSRRLPGLNNPSILIQAEQRKIPSRSELRKRKGTFRLHSSFGRGIL